MEPSMSVALRIVYLLAGLAVIFLGLNVGFGGIRTLGWQGGTDFLAVTDPGLFAVRDSHVRFLGGVWLGLGLTLCAATWKPAALKSTVLAICGMVFVGGVVRLVSTGLAVVTGPDLLQPLILELAAFPALALWTWKSAPNA